MDLNKPKIKKMDSESAFFDWAYDTSHQNYRSTKIAYIIAAVASFVAILSICAVLYLTPLKEVKPFIITVDKTTGLIDTSTTISELTISREEAIDFSNMALYIRLRESYVPQLYPTNYSQAVTMSAGNARTELINLFAPDKSKSPMLILGGEANVSITFKNDMAYQTSNILISRFVATMTRGDKITTEHYIATITFTYNVDSTLSLNARLQNPLGFIVTNYQISKESI